MPDPNSYQAIGWMVVVLAGLVVIANQGIQLWRNAKRPTGPEQRRIQEPVVITSVEKYAAETDCNERAVALQKQIDELRRLRESDDVAASRHRKAVYDKIDDVRSELSAKIDTMPAQIVTQLLSTKQLWREPK